MTGLDHLMNDIAELEAQKIALQQNIDRLKSWVAAIIATARANGVSLSAKYGG